MYFYGIHRHVYAFKRMNVQCNAKKNYVEMNGFCYEKYQFQWNQFDTFCKFLFSLIFIKTFLKQSFSFALKQKYFFR